MEYSSSSDFAINVLQFSGEKSEGKKMGNHSSKLSKSPTRDEIKDATISLLRRLLTLTQTFGPLPSKRDLVMRLLYYPDVTPLDYGPAHFQTQVTEAEEAADDRTDMEHIHLSTISTPFHGIGFSYVLERGFVRSGDMAKSDTNATPLRSCRRLLRQIRRVGCGAS